MMIMFLYFVAAQELAVWAVFGQCVTGECRGGGPASGRLPRRRVLDHDLIPMRFEHRARWYLCEQVCKVELTRHVRVLADNGPFVS